MATIQGVYVALFGRPADPFGLEYWKGVTNDGANLENIGDLAQSQEYQDRFAGQSYTQVVNAIYQSLFNRPADVAGLTYWVNGLQSGEFTVNDVAIRILDGAQGSDKDLVDTKVAAADLFTASLDTAEEIIKYDGNAAAQIGRDFLAGVSTDVPTQAEVDAAIANVVSGGGVVTDFTLTTGIDNLTGTSGDDLFLATANGGTVADGTTLNSGDTIKGGEGYDVLRVVTSAATTAVPNLTGVEQIDAQVFGGALTLNLATSTGVEKLSLSNGSNGFTAQNVGKLVDLELNNTTGGTLQATYQAAVVAGAADAQNVAINSAIGAVNVAGVETINVTSTGAAASVEQNSLGITAANLKTLNIDGAGKLAITGGALAATVTTVDASKSTGGVSVALGAANVTVTGGAGDDVFTFAGTLTKDDVVDGGEGFDTVSVAGGNLSVATNATLQGINALVNIERVAFTGDGTTVNGSTFKNAGVTNLLFNTDAVLGGADVINNAGSARTYEFGTLNTGSATFNMAGGSTTLNVELLGSKGLDAVAQDGSDADVAGLTVVLSGVEASTAVATINLASTGDLKTFNRADNTSYNETGLISAKSGSTVNVTGEAALAIAGSANNVTINAADFTGAFIVEGSEAAGIFGAVAATKQVLTNTGVDTITLGSGKSIITFGSANDSGTIVLAGEAGSVAATGAIYHDVINNFTAGAGGDLLDWTTGGDTRGYTATSAAIQADIDALAGASATLLAAANIAANGHNVADGWTAFSFQGETYALYETGAADNAGGYSDADLLVKLTGVAVGDLTAANFA